MKSVQPTVLSTHVQSAVDSYVPHPVGPSLADYVGMSLIQWLSSPPASLHGAGSPVRLSCPSIGGTPFGLGGDGPNPLMECNRPPYGGEGPKPYLYASKDLATSDDPQPILHPADDLPENKTFLSQTESDFKTGGRFRFYEPADHRIYARVRRFLPASNRLSNITPNENGVLHNPYYPWVSFFEPSTRIPSDWIRGSYNPNPSYYFVEGLTPLWEGGWNLYESTYYEEWLLNGGTYRWFGFLEPLTSPLTPPGDFVVEVVTIYYYRGKSTGTGFNVLGEVVDLGKKQ